MTQRGVFYRVLLPLLRARPGGVVKLIQTKIGAMWPTDRGRCPTCSNGGATCQANRLVV